MGKQGAHYAPGLFDPACSNFSLTTLQGKKERQEGKDRNYKVFTVTTMSRKKIVVKGETVIMSDSDKDQCFIAGAWASFSLMTSERKIPAAKSAKEKTQVFKNFL